MANEITEERTPEQYATIFQDMTWAELGALDAAVKTEKERRDLEEVKRAKRAGAIAFVPVNILKSVAAIAQTVTGIRGLKGLRAPIPPAPPERDVQLLERMRRARLEAEQPVTPAMQRAREATAVEAAGRGRETARAATAGQLGLYAPLAQATNLGILKQMRAGVMEDEALRAQRQQIFDRLLQQRAGETARIQRAKEQRFYGFQYPEFEAQRAGYRKMAQAGVTGMQDILGGIPEMATAFAAGRKTPVSPTGQPIYPMQQQFGPYELPMQIPTTPYGLPETYYG